MLVKRFCNEIQPQLDAAELELAPLLQLRASTVFQLRCGNGA